MVAQLTSIHYPDSDGKPMADNTKQFRWIVVIEQNLEWLYADDPQVFVAGDLLWYPVEGRPDIRVAPDALVVFGRPKGDRGSYQQWKEDHIAPQVVFEILSPGNTKIEMEKKLLFYDRYDVQEYYIYDPDHPDLEGWLRGESGSLENIPTMPGWVSPLLGIRFELPEELQLYFPDGTPFSSYQELHQKLLVEQQKVLVEQQKVLVEQQKVLIEQQKVQRERQRADELAALLAQYQEKFGELP